MAETQSRVLSKLDEIEKRLLESTPELRELYKKGTFGRESLPPSSEALRRTIEIAGYSAHPLDMQNKAREMEGLIAEERKKGKALAKEIEGRQLRYVKREQEYRKTLLDYERQLKSNATLGRISLSEPTYKHLERISSMHDQILANIGTVQSKTSLILDEQEKDITKDFNSELNRLVRDLEEEKRRKLEGVGSFAERESRLRMNLELTRAKIELVEQTNKALQRKNRDLKIELSSQIGDRELLAVQIQETEDLNSKLREAIEREKAKAMEDTADLVERTEEPHPLGRSLVRSDQGKALRYEKVLAQMRHRLDSRRRKIVETKQSLEQLQSSRTELEVMLSGTVERVKSEIRAQGDIHKRGSEALGAQDRERIVEWLLSQERVLTLLYDQTFPPLSSQ